MAQLSDLRKQAAAAQQQATQLAAQLRLEQQALNAAVRQGNTAAANTHKQNIANLQAQRAKALADAAAAQQQVDTQRGSALTTAPDPIAGLDASVPLVLLPVRLETRIVGTDLLIRVYPDDIHIDSHEPGLTADEDRRGRDYRTQVAQGRAASDAWADLARFHGPQRAAYILKTIATADAPAVASRPSSWSKAPVAALLPDRWVALGYTAGGGRIFTAAGSPIPDQLIAGLSPDDSGAAPPPGGTDALQVIDPAMRWLFDFTEALKVGMALRVTLPAGVPALSRLLVFGVKTTMDAGEGSAALADLLDAHRFTSGFTYLRRGTPTNNTADAPSGSRIDEAGDFTPPAANAAGALAVRAFGASVTAFASAPGSADQSEASSRAMNSALWPSTWGYYIEQLLAGVVSDPGWSDFREHFLDYVRAGGPLPPVRIGKKPYGILPVTSLTMWASAGAADIPPRAITVLQNLRDAFRRAAGDLPHMGATGDPDQDLLSVLRMNAYSTSYSLRHMFGPWYVANFWAFQGTPTDSAWWSAQASAAALRTAIPGLPANTLQATALFAPAARGLGDKPLVDSGEGIGYLTALATADLASLRANTVLAAGSRTLLYDLARHSLLLAYARAARAVQAKAGVAVDVHEPELVDIDGQTNTVWRQLDQPVAAVTGTAKLGDYLAAPGNAPEVAGVQAGLKTLAAENADTLAMLLSETLDTASHRWDAWATSVATRRLAAIRGQKPAGLLVGGYGWVDNLTPGSASPPDGYIHTPSPVHATTAAILASGYLSHRTGASSNPFAVDLSAPRVKLANRLIDGVRTGQPLAALLGYELELDLHDANLSLYVARFRNIAPLVATPVSGGQVSESVAANNVVHGERIIAMWKTKDPGFQALRSPANTADFVKIDAIFTSLDAEVDALGDVMTANSVFQIAQGNFNRAGLSLDAVLRGEFIPDQEVVRTPRTGTGCTHRVLQFLDTASGPPPGWANTPLQARAQADPLLNAWAAGLLPKPDQIACQAVPAGGGNKTVRIADLQLSALDAVFLSESELRQRISVFLGADPSTPVDFDNTPAAVSFNQFLAMTSAIHALLGAARPLTGSDLTGMDDPGAIGIDFAELQARGDAAVAALQSVRDAAATKNAAALMRAAHFGLSNALPVPGRADYQLLGVVSDCTSRLNSVGQLNAQFDRATASPDAVFAYERARMRAVFGSDFQIAPRFTLAQPSELPTAFGASDALLGNRPMEAMNWFTRASQVRPQMANAADVLRFAEAFLSAVPVFSVGQLPFAPGEPWLALPSDPGAPRKGQLSLFAIGPVNLKPSLAGLVFDEWNEVIPDAKQTTAIALNYDRPGARAPHAILLAVAPNIAKPWDLPSLEAVLLETIEMAQLRLVDQDAMQELDQFLPALSVAMNAAGDTVASDLRVR